jgi:hypothetical protein
VTDVFISYAREDRERAAALAQVLERDGWSVWWDRRIVAGESFDRVIERELESARCVVVLWSEAAIASEWVRNEAAMAAERDVLVPARLDQARPPLEFRRRQTVDLAGWEGDPSHAGLQALREGVAVTTGRPLARTAPASSRGPATSPRSGGHWIPVGLAIVALAAGIAWWGMRGPHREAPSGAAARTAQEASDPAALIAGTYSGAVVSDARGGSRSDVTVTVARLGHRRVRITSDYARLGSVDVDLDRVGDSVQSTGSGAVVMLDLAKTPPELSYNPDGGVVYAGQKR